MRKISVLLIEDNQVIAEQICDYLTQNDVLVDYAHLGKLGLSLVADNQYDVIILDLMLPDIDGVEICKRIKAQGEINTPILMLTARDSLAEKMTGFDAGTDDYLTKPFELPEVLMRCHALAKRHQLHQANTIDIGDLSLDVQQRIAKRNGKLIELTVTDFNLLLLLAQAYPNAMSRNQLTAKVWGDDFPDSDVLRSHIYTLRSAIDKPFATKMIKTIHGVGFKLVAEG